MAAVNYYLGIKRGADNKPFVSVVSGTSTIGTAADVEVRLQTNDGSVATGLTRKDAIIALQVIMEFINSGGLNHAGANLPVL